VRTRTLSARLTLAALVAVLIAVVVLGVGARLIVNHQLRSSLDGSLRQRATDVARLSVSAPAVLTAPGALEAPVSGRQLSVEVLDRHGVIVARSLALGAKLLPRGPVVSAAFHGRSGFADVQLAGEPLRLFAAPVADVSGPVAGGVVLVASSTKDIRETTHRLSLLLLLCGLLAAGVGGGAAAILTRRSLRPLQHLSSSASEIEKTGDSSRRLAEPLSADEVGELARTLNRMLAALEQATGRERRFLADASHELRTPLTSLAGNVDFVARHGTNAEVIADLEHDAARLRHLLDDLLALERQDVAAPPQQPVRLDRTVVEASEHWPQVRVVVDGPVTVLGEPDALRRALENLIENAAVHGPADGAIDVALSVSGNLAEVSVRDQGPGLGPQAAKRAFDRFWRGHDAVGRPGSGLGLAIVKATAERHGGSVRASGSTVVISLPVA
jgi:two-component system OmpR family sensor kinase